MHLARLVTLDQLHVLLPFPFMKLLDGSHSSVFCLLVLSFNLSYQLFIVLFILDLVSDSLELSLTHDI